MLIVLISSFIRLVNFCRWPPCTHSMPGATTQRWPGKTRHCLPLPYRLVKETEGYTGNHIAVSQGLGWATACNGSTNREPGEACWAEVAGCRLSQPALVQPGWRWSGTSPSLQGDLGQVASALSLLSRHNNLISFLILLGIKQDGECKMLWYGA